MLSYKWKKNYIYVRKITNKLIDGYEILNRSNLSIRISREVHAAYKQQSLEVTAIRKSNQSKS